MARIIEIDPTPVESIPEWQIAGEEVVHIALDKNEVVALVQATRDFKQRVDREPKLARSSISASGARVHALLAEIRMSKDWH